MVRERVGDWRLAWRFALAGLIAGMLVTAFGYFGVINRSFDAAQDQLFPAPSADPRITLVAIDQRSNDSLGAYPWLNSYHAKVINYLASLHPKVILFDVVLDHLTFNDPENPTENTTPSSRRRSSRRATSSWSAPRTMRPGLNSRRWRQRSASAGSRSLMRPTRSGGWSCDQRTRVRRTKRRSPLSCRR